MKVTKVLTAFVIVGAFFCGLHYKPGDWKLYIGGVAVGLVFALIGYARS